MQNYSPSLASDKQMEINTNRAVSKHYLPEFLIFQYFVEKASWVTSCFDFTSSTLSGFSSLQSQESSLKMPQSFSMLKARQFRVLFPPLLLHFRIK